MKISNLPQKKRGKTENPASATVNSVKPDPVDACDAIELERP